MKQSSTFLSRLLMGVVSITALSCFNIAEANLNQQELQAKNILKSAYLDKLFITNFLTQNSNPYTRDNDNLNISNMVQTTSSQKFSGYKYSQNTTGKRLMGGAAGTLAGAVGGATLGGLTVAASLGGLALMGPVVAVPMAIGSLLGGAIGFDQRLKHATYEKITTNTVTNAHNYNKKRASFYKNPHHYELLILSNSTIDRLNHQLEALPKKTPLSACSVNYVRLLYKNIEQFKTNSRSNIITSEQYSTLTKRIRSFNQKIAQINSKYAFNLQNEQLNRQLEKMIDFSNNYTITSLNFDNLNVNLKFEKHFRMDYFKLDNSGGFKEELQKMTNLINKDYSDYEIQSVFKLSKGSNQTYHSMPHSPRTDLKSSFFMGGFRKRDWFSIISPKYITEANQTYSMISNDEIKDQFFTSTTQILKSGGFEYDDQNLQKGDANITFIDHLNFDNIDEVHMNSKILTSSYFQIGSRTCIDQPGSKRKQLLSFLLKAISPHEYYISSFR